MLYVSTEKIKYSTVGATFTVTFHTPIDEIGYLQALHDKYAEMNMKSFTLAADKVNKGENETRLTAKCLNCVNGGSYKCSKCDGEMYFKDELQTERSRR